MIPTGRARLAGVMGWPVSHSRSPRLHGYWLEHYGIDGAYVPLAVAPAHLSAALSGLVALGFAGANVTLPHKEAVLRSVDRVDAEARRVGAVNTVIVAADGTLEGRNTDVFGFREALRAAAPDLDLGAGPTVVLGAGGAARAVVAALVAAGAADVIVTNRTRERAERLVADLGGRAEPWMRRAACLEGAVLLVNATALGMEGSPPLEIALDRLPATAVVADLVYAPLETALLRTARGRGHVTVDGLEMLMHQGRPGFRTWFGVDPEVTSDLRAFLTRELDGERGAEENARGDA